MIESCITALLTRPLLTAIEKWELESVQWIFSGEDQIDKEVSKMLGWRGKHYITGEFLLSLQNIQKFDAWKTDPLRARVITMKKTVEDCSVLLILLCLVLCTTNFFTIHLVPEPGRISCAKASCIPTAVGQDLRSDVASITSAILVCELLVHREKYPDKLAAVRKLCKGLAAELGMAKADLNPILIRKMEEFQKSGDPAEESEYLALGIFQTLPLPQSFCLGVVMIILLSCIICILDIP